ncbi:MAG: GNAT family N-acetyltransferase [Coriobacteriia bacterium]|nr:GNAT family N-acetyltransferase [Coriobacteriia bacterium]
MEAILLEILGEINRVGHLDDKALTRIIRAHSKGLGDRDPASRGQYHPKRKLLAYYFRTKESDPKRWASWRIDQATEKHLLRALRVKPRRTASGVATITVITKPWKCSSNCLYCPNDLRMPKSYLSDEPACQRAERNYFDPYLQVASRLRALTQMGHNTDKVELIILGGTWSDYPTGYQIWFVAELFRALNDGDNMHRHVKRRRRFYKNKGLGSTSEELQGFVGEKQREVSLGQLTYNQAIEQLYGNSDVWKAIAFMQAADFDELVKEQGINETARHRVVGLAIETRPDTVTCSSLMLLRRLGCTKVQMGIQSLSPSVLRLNNRNMDVGTIRTSFELLRLFGFKIHAHFMLNLYGSSSEEDKRDYRQFVTEKMYLPDEVKLYPCVLVDGTGLCAHNASTTPPAGTDAVAGATTSMTPPAAWRPYAEEELIDLLVADMLITPPFMRISRMIRDISAHDILAGNKRANLRQLVERRAKERGGSISEIRCREISTSEIDIGHLALETLPYETTVTSEHFLQWVTHEGRIAGFLRLSLPKAECVEAAHAGQQQAYAGSQQQAALPIGLGEAMIREVHVYGKVAELRRPGEGASGEDVAGAHEGAAATEARRPGAGAGGEGAQHLGLGRRLIEAACDIARAQGYAKVNVISSVGTREYYRGLGFRDNGLYQQMVL